MKRMKLYQDLRALSTPIGEEAVFRYSNKYTNYAAMIGSLIFDGIDKGDYRLLAWSPDFPYKDEFFYDRLQTDGALLLISNMVAGVVVDVVLRSLSGDYIFMYENSIPYGFPDFVDWIYGKTPIIVVEGVADVDYLRMMIWLGTESGDYLRTIPIVAARTSGLSMNHVELLSKVGDKYILCLDNDTAGLKGRDDTIRYLTEKGAQIQLLDNPVGIKDPGIYGEVMNDRDLELEKGNQSLVDYYNEALRALEEYYVERLRFLVGMFV